MEQPHTSLSVAAVSTFLSKQHTFHSLQMENAAAKRKHHDEASCWYHNTSQHMPVQLTPVAVTLALGTSRSMWYVAGWRWATCFLGLMFIAGVHQWAACLLRAVCTAESLLGLTQKCLWTKVFFGATAAPGVLQDLETTEAKKEEIGAVLCADDPLRNVSNKATHLKDLFC